ncbi:MAG: hypothetical protein V1775_05480 [Bacteroidota bacterium]
MDLIIKACLEQTGCPPLSGKMRANHSGEPGLHICQVSEES